MRRPWPRPTGGGGCRAKNKKNREFYCKASEICICTKVHKRGESLRYKPADGRTGHPSMTEKQLSILLLHRGLLQDSFKAATQDVFQGIKRLECGAAHSAPSRTSGITSLLPSTLSQNDA
jgi:hypothetical protein